MSYKILQHGDLRKRGGHRLNIFLDKVKKGEPFLTSQGEIILEKSQYPFLKNNMNVNGFSAELEAKKGARKITVSYPKDFYKTAEFGGKGIGSGTAAEDRYMKNFRDELLETLEEIRLPYLRIKLNNRIVSVADIYQPKGTPKSDFNLIDHEGNDVGWLSHKAGYRPTDFQQYGGLSDSVFNRSMEVKKFMHDLRNMYPKGLGRGESIWRYVKNRDTIGRSIYGIDYGKRPGLDNVDEFHQGEMKLVKQGRVFAIRAHHSEANGYIPRKGSGYEAIFYARYTSDRGANIAGVFVNNARVGVFPIAKAARTAEQI